MEALVCSVAFRANPIVKSVQEGGGFWVVIRAPIWMPSCVAVCRIRRQWSGSALSQMNTRQLGYVIGRVGLFCRSKKSLNRSGWGRDVLFHLMGQSMQSGDQVQEGPDRREEDRAAFWPCLFKFSGDLVLGGSIWQASFCRCLPSQSDRFRKGPWWQAPEQEQRHDSPSGCHYRIPGQSGW